MRALLAADRLSHTYSQVQFCAAPKGRILAELGCHVVAAGDQQALWPTDVRTLGMQSGTEESRLAFDFVAGHSKGQEQLFRGALAEFSWGNPC